MFDNYADVDILVNNKPVRQFAHQNKLFVQSNHQTEYAIKIRNKAWCRRLFIVTVDGINVIDGESGGKSKMGYIINGKSTYEVKGFRTSNNEVHPFKFSSKKKSYAAKSDSTEGDTSNCGVIGIEVYDEKEKPKPHVIYRDRIIEKEVPAPYPVFPPYSPYTPWSYITWTLNTSAKEDYQNYSSTSSLRCFNNASSALGGSCNSMDASFSIQAKSDIEPNFDMGTEFSQHSINDVVSEVEFEIGRLLSSLNLYYASRDALASMGIQVVKISQITSFPEAFPSRFCKPPK